MTGLRIEVPATSANLGPGFDTLGLALDLLNVVQVEFDHSATEARIVEISGPHQLEVDPVNNLLCAAYQRWADDTGAHLPGARFRLESTIPVARGLGSSAAAIVAGLSAAAFAAGDKQPRDRIVRLACLIEGHADNAVAATLGGVTAGFIDGDRVHALSVANHLNLGVALFVPGEPLLTAEARAVIPDSIPRRDAVFNVGRVAYLTTALIWGRWECIGPAMEDRLHQPYRARRLPALADVIAAAKASGAYGAALSGGGPAVIALGSEEQASEFAAAMEQAALQRDWKGQSMVRRIRHLGVQVTKI